jgi:hypothetical protein
MTRTEDEVRATLRNRAERLSQPIDVFAGVEARAKRMHRNRVAAAVGGAVAAVIAVAVVVPTVVVGGSPHKSPVLGPTPSGTTQPTQPTQPTPTPSQSPGSTTSDQATPPPTTGPVTLDPAHPWAYRGDPSVGSGATLAAFQNDWNRKHPGSKLHPLWGEIYEPSAQPELIFVAETSDGTRWGMAMKTQSGTNFIVDKPFSQDNGVLLVAAPGDEVARLLAVAAPEVKAIQYAPDGVNYQDMFSLQPGVYVNALEGDSAKDMVRVIGIDGAMVFEGPAPNLGQ